MVTRKSSMRALLLAAFLIGSAPLAHADQVKLSSTGLVFWPGFGAGDVLRVTFDMSAYEAPPQRETLDVLSFTTFLNPVEPIGSYTASVFDRGRLLGSYTAAFDPNQLVSAYFKASTSIFSLGNPSLIDFSSFNDGTFRGAVELTINGGVGNGGRISEGLLLGRTVDMSSFLNNTVAYPDQHANWEVIPESTSPVPEPASLLLLGTGTVAVAVRERRRRSQRHLG